MRFCLSAEGRVAREKEDYPNGWHLSRLSRVVTLGASIIALRHQPDLPVAGEAVG
jgi:hypothetical protein